MKDCPECYTDGYRAGLEAMLQQVREQGIPPEIDPAERARLEKKFPEFGKARVNVPETHKEKRKPTARNKAYSKAFKAVAPEFKKKNGSWKKNGFKNCSKKANGMCK